MPRLLTVVLLIALLLSVNSAFAKRGAPKPVPPVKYKGITYSAPNNYGMINYVLASDSTGKELFRIKVFEMPIDTRLEEDVQWVFITDLTLTGSLLQVKDEKGRCYVINLDTKAVKRKYWCLF
jgi:hypothetical protein